MARADRAKIFMPFAALRGFGEVLERTRPEETPPRELTEEERAELDRQLMLILQHREAGQNVMATVTLAGEAEPVSGMVTAISLEARFLRLVDRRVPLDGLTRVEFVLAD